MGRVNRYMEPFFWDLKEEVLAAIDKESFEDNISINLDEIKANNGIYLEEDGFEIVNYGEFSIEYKELSNIIGGTCYVQYKVSNIGVKLFEDYTAEDAKDLDMEQLFNENYVSEEQLLAYTNPKEAKTKGMKAFTAANLKAVREKWLQDKKASLIKKDEADIYVSLLVNVQYDMDIDYISVEEIEVCY